MGLGLAPIGHSVTVDTVRECKLDIMLDVVVLENFNRDTMKEEIIKQISKYLLELRKKWEDEQKLIIRVSQIESRILNIEGILDIASTTVNSSISNIELEFMQIPVLGEVVIL